MQEGFPFYLMIGIRYTAAAVAAAPTHCNHTRYDVFIEADGAAAVLASEADMTDDSCGGKV